MKIKEIIRTLLLLCVAMAGMIQFSGCAKKTEMIAVSSVSRSTKVNLLYDYIIPSFIYSPGFDYKKITQLVSAKYAGIYSYGDNQEDEPNGNLSVYPLTDTSVIFYLFKSIGPPSYNLGSIEGVITIKKNIGKFKALREVFDCELTFLFSSGTIIVKTDENICECGFGHSVYADGTYFRKNSNIPEFYVDAHNDTIYFKNLPQSSKYHKRKININ